MLRLNYTKLAGVGGGNQETTGLLIMLMAGIKNQLKNGN
jgi:hypothetical protein